jgi:hypothetical protein
MKGLYRRVLTRPTRRINMIVGVESMNNFMKKNVLLVICMKETWVWQTITAVTAEEGVILFLRPPLPNHQALQRSQLLLRALPHQLHQFVSTRRVGMIGTVMIVRGTKSWMILDVLDMEMRPRILLLQQRGQQMIIAVTASCQQWCKC